jgi:tetratricopeptide (TPR) repeat protein
MRVAVYALARNEAANVAAWEASCRDADVRVVTDTGSTDGTQEMLAAAGVTVVSGSPQPWRWDDAHNLSLMHVPADVDVCIRLDLDEQLDPGWREALEADWKPDTTKLRYWYHWSESVRFLCDRIHSRGGYRWTGATHEGLVRWSGDDVEAYSERLVIRHHRQPGKSHGTDLTLLRQAVRENPLDARMQWYLARELDYGNSDEAVPAFERYLTLAGGTPHERAYAYRVLARRQADKGTRRLLEAIIQSPCEPEAYLTIAERAWGMEDAVAALYYARQAMACHRNNQTHTSDPRAYGSAAADLAASAAWKLGRFEEAARHAAEAAKRSPDDDRLTKNAARLARMVAEPGPKPW